MPLAYEGNNAYKLQDELYDVSDKEQYNGSPKLKPNQEEKQCGKLKTMSMVLFCFGIAFYVLLRYVAINEASSRVNDLKQQLASLESANQQAQIKLESSINLKKVEEMAINKLGMCKPDKYQIVYINVQNRDHAEIVEHEQKEKKSTGAFAVIMKTIHNVLEYLH